MGDTNTLRIAAQTLNKTLQGNDRKKQVHGDQTRRSPGRVLWEM